MDFDIVSFALGLLAGGVVGAVAAIGVASVRRVRLEMRLAASEGERERLSEELARGAADAERRRMEFATLSEEVLRGRQEALVAENAKSVGGLLAPMREELERFRKAFADSMGEEKAGAEALRSMVAQEMKRMQELAGKVGEDARGLKAALLGNVNVRGQWGEAILEGLLRDSGLLKDVHYSTQATLADDDGRGRPDVVVHLPDGVNVVIDSKALFPNYLQYVEAETPEARKRAIAEHLQSVRDTITALSRRHYETRVEGSVEFVVMFFPLEGAYQLVLSSEPKILSDALQKHVLPVGPATLVVMLTIVERLWRRNEQDRNAKAILAAAQELANRVVAFGNELDAIGKGLDNARAAYDDAVRRLSSPDGRSKSVASHIAALAALGIDGSRGKLPQSLQPAEE